MYGAGSSVAAGDVLVTIKAKYDSVNDALKSLKNIDKAIVSINKTKLGIDAKGTGRGLDELTGKLDGVEKATRRASQATSGFVLSNRQMRNSLAELNGQLQDAQRDFLETADAQEQAMFAGSKLAMEYKRMRIEAEALSNAQKNLWAKKTPTGKGDPSYGPIGDVKNLAKEWKDLPLTFHNVESSLQQVNFLVRHAVKDGEEWNVLADAQNDLLAKQVILQDTLSGKVKKRIEMEKQALSGQRGPFVPKTASGMSSDLSIYKKGGIPGQMKDLDPAAREWNIMVRKNAGTAKSIYEISKRLQNALQAVLRQVGATETEIARIRVEDIIRDLTFDPNRRAGLPGSGTGGLPGALTKELGLASGAGYKQLLTDPRLAKAVRMLEDAGVDVQKLGDTSKGLNTNFDELTDSIRRFRQELDATKTGQARQGAMQGPRRANVQERFQRRYGRALPEQFHQGVQRGGMAGAGFRGARRGMRGMFGGKTAQNFLLGGGFPMLFGGGAGAVGGSLAGSGMAAMMGMPQAGFGLQIMGSALGTMLEGTLAQSKKLADALAEMNIDNLLSQGIRLSAEMQFQVAMLEKQGRYKEARGLMESQVQKQTGASGSNMRVVAGAVNILGAAWNDFRNSVGATLGIIASPFLVALAGILKVVGNIFAMWNGAMATIKSGIDLLGQFVPDAIKGKWKKFTDGLNKGLQTGLAKLSEVNVAMAKQNQVAKEIFDLEKQKYTLASNTGQKIYNDELTRRAEILEMTRKHDNEMSDFNKKWKKELDSMNEEEQEAWRKHLKEKQDQEEESLRLRATRRRAALLKAWEMEQATGEHRVNMLDRELQLLREKDELAAGKGMFGQGTAQLEKQWALQKQIVDKIEAIKLKRKQLDIADDKGHPEIYVLEKQLQILREKLGIVERTSDEVMRQRQLWAAVGDTINNSIVSAIESAITKAKSFGEILSSLLMSVGRMFLSAGVNQMMGNIFNPPQQNRTQFRDPGWVKTARGGYIDGPTRALIGEGGEGEYVIPESQMSDAMARYSGGARGGDVLAGGGSDVAEGGASGGGTGAIDVTFNTQVINDVSYVSYAEFEAGVTAAARQGARQGEMAALRRLQTSPSARRRIGV